MPDTSTRHHPSPFPCPACGETLAPFTHEGVEIDLCGGCGGLWFDRGELEGALGVDLPHIAPASEADEDERRCPTCPGRLAARQTHMDPEVVVDVCRACEGIFLDRGELVRVRRLAHRTRHIPRPTAALARGGGARPLPVPNAGKRRRAGREPFFRQATLTGSLFLLLVSIPLEDENDLSRTPWVTYGLIALNLIVWGAMLFAFGDLDLAVEAFAMRPVEILGGERLWTLGTNMFAHVGWAHVLGNLYFLWLFGDNVEDRLGPGHFLALFLVTGLAADGLEILLGAPEHGMIRRLGASGAVSGVMGAYMVLFPRKRILSPFFRFFHLLWLISLPAWLWIGAWAAMNVAFAWMGVGGVAWFAHIGGFATGAIWALLVPDALDAPRSTRPRRLSYNGRRVASLLFRDSGA